MLDALADRGLRAIIPLRTSTGPTSPPPKGIPIERTVANDALKIMDHLGITRAPVVCVLNDLIFGVKLAKLAPERITAVIGAGASLPAVEDAHMARLDVATRFMYKNMRLAPKLMTYVTLALSHPLIFQTTANV